MAAPGALHRFFEPKVPAGAAGCAELGHGVLAGAGAVVAVGIAVDWAWLAERR